MAISGTVPTFDVSPNPHLEAPAIVTVTGTEADSQATGAVATEGLAAFLVRGLNALSVSGILSGTAQAITPAELSGIMHFQQELAFRHADLTAGRAATQATRLTSAQTALAAASGASHTGQVAFGS